MQDLKNRIIKLLVEDSRFTAEKIADILGEERSAVKDIIAKLEKDGVIVRYSAIIDRDKADEAHIEALVEIKVVPMKAGGYDEIAERLVQFSEIKSLSLYSGGFDFGMVVEGKDVRDVAFFIAERLSTLDCIQSTATHFILKKYKSEGAILPDGDKIVREVNN